MQFLDVVKWAGAQNSAETRDVMVVEDTDDEFITVRHLQNGQLSKEREVNLKVVGRCTPYEPVKNIVERYINS